jgi:hypothetical protein
VDSGTGDVTLGLNFTYLDGIYAAVGSLGNYVLKAGDTMTCALGIGTTPGTDVWLELNASYTGTSSWTPEQATFSRSATTTLGVATYFDDKDYILSGTGGSFGNTIGHHNKITVSSTGTNSSIRNYNSRLQVNAGGRVLNYAGYSNTFDNNATGIVTNYYGTVLGTLANVSSFTNAGTITNTYGLYLGTLSGGTQTNAPWAIYSIDSTARTYHAGSIGIGTTSTNAVTLYAAKTLTGATLANSIISSGAIQSDVTSAARYYLSAATTAAATFNLTNLMHYQANQGTFGTGSTVTNQYGFYIDTTLVGATNNYGVYGGIATGTGRWNLYMAGSASNFLAGALGIGSTSVTTSNLVVTRPVTGATTAYSVQLSSTVSSDVTLSAYGVSSVLSTQAASFTLTNLAMYRANQGTIGAGSSVTNQYGFLVEGTLTGATNNFGFYSNIATTANTNRWNFYANSTAPNYMNGGLTLGNGVIPPNSGGILTLGTLVAGTGYTDGTYNDVQLSYNGTAGLGIGGFVNVVVSGGVVTTVTLIWGGTRYRIGDVLTVSNTLLGGTGQDFTISVATILAAQLNINNTVEPTIRFERNDTGITIGDTLGRIAFSTNDTTAKASGDQAQILVKPRNASGGGQFEFQVSDAGAAMVDALDINYDKSVLGYGDWRTSGQIRSDIRFVGQATDTATAPSYTWNGWEGTLGMYRSGSAQIGWTTAGTLRMTIGNTALTTSTGVNLSVGGTATITTINALGTAGTTFLTHTAGLIQSRTAAQVLSDIGAAPSSSVHNPVTIGTANGLSLATQVLSLAAASTSTTGALTSTDWNTFNGKQAALNGTGFVKATGTTISYDNTSYLATTGGSMTGNLVTVGVIPAGNNTHNLGFSATLQYNNIYGRNIYQDGVAVLTANQNITLTGDTTGSGTTSIVTTIANDAVTFAKMQNISSGKLLGRFTAGTGDVEEITPDTNYFYTSTTNLRSYTKHNLTTKLNRGEPTAVEGWDFTDCRVLYEQTNPTGVYTVTTKDTIILSTDDNTALSVRLPDPNENIGRQLKFRVVNTAGLIEFWNATGTSDLVVIDSVDPVLGNQYIKVLGYNDERKYEWVEIMAVPDMIGDFAGWTIIQAGTNHPQVQLYTAA